MAQFGCDILVESVVRFDQSDVAAVHAVVLLTEWDIFRGTDLSELKKTMKGKDLWDGRNVYEPEEVREGGSSIMGLA